MKKYRLPYIFAVPLLIFSTNIVYAQTPDADAFLQMGHKRLNSGDVNGAIEFYKKSLEVDPNFEAAKSSLESATHEKDLIIFSKNFPAACQTGPKDFDQNLACAQKYFVMEGKPINPMIIRDLNTWISDSGDQVIAINLLASQESNRYFSKTYTAQKLGEYFSVEISSASEEKESFKYSIKGVTDNGVFVIETTWWGGGSGIFSNLLFVRIIKAAGFGEVKNNKLTLNNKRILIEKLGGIGFGDRVWANVTVQGNSVHIKTQNPQFPEENIDKMIIELSLDNK